ncbi:fibronectin type III domain-containing protein [Candidatus Pacearchaeota archaeon]|nr:fibronectin type III domain-containing protein [Candidatus Pacearchaeota archaeon]
MVKKIGKKRGKEEKRRGRSKNKGLYYLTFFLVFVIAFILFSIVFLNVLSAFPDKPRVRGLFQSIDELNVPFFKAFVITGRQISGQATLVCTNGLADCAASMQSGDWAELQTNNINPTLDADGSSGFLLGFAESIRWDPTSRKLFFVGADHGDSTHFVIYDELTNDWYRNDAGAPLPGGVNHGYDHMAVDPTRGYFYVRHGYTGTYLDRYHIASETWTATPSNSDNGCCNGIDYFSELDGVLWYGGMSLLLYKETTNQWTTLTTSAPAGTYNNFLESNPIHKVAIFGGGNGDRRLYKVNGSEQVSALSNASIDLGTQDSMVTFDPIEGDYLVFANGRQFWRYNVVTDSWQNLTATANIPARVWRDTDRVHGMVTGAIPTHGVIVVVTCDGGSPLPDCRVHLYKHAPSAPDTNPPATISNLAVNSCSQNNCTLSWTAPGDDGNTGAAVSYDVRYSTSPITTANWASATQVSGEPFPQIAGTSQNMIVSGLQSGVSYYFAIIASDDAGNQGGLSNVASGLTALPPVYIGGYPMPLLEDEKNAYRKWNWTWTTSIEPDLPCSYPSDTPPCSQYFVSDPDIHYDTEGDDLWTYLMMYLRTGENGYLDRANAWARYFKDDYRNCVGSPSLTFCNDKAGYGIDHMYGWGLVALYEYTKDTDPIGAQEALTEAENLAAEVESQWIGAVPGQYRMADTGMRRAARHLLLVTRVAEATKKQRWIDLRDRLIELWIQSPDWDARGMYFVGQWSTDTITYPGYNGGTYADGVRKQSAFHIGLVAEAFFQAYRVTGRQELKDRAIAMARYVEQYGLEPTSQYTAAFFGFNATGGLWYSYIDPVYTTDLVNILMLGYKYTGEQHFYDQAVYFFNRGTKGAYSTGARLAADNEVHHFIDTLFDSSYGNFYLSRNKGELLFTYLIFESGNSPVSDTTPPTTPTGLTANAVSSSRIDLTWTASSDDESGIANYKVYRNNVNVGQPTTTSFSDTGLSEGQSYSYEVSAVNGAGLESARSSAVNRATLNVAPSISSVSATSQTSVRVIYSEAMNRSTIQTIGNYLINGITISSLSVSADNTTATLTTSAMTNGTSYALTISNVRDLAGNFISPNPTNVNYLYQEIVIPSGLAAHWKFDEGTGSSAADSSGNGNNGAITSPSWTIGRIGNALSFSGASYITVPNSASLDIVGRNISIAAWLSPLDTPGDAVLIEKQWTAGSMTSPYYQYGIELDNNGDGSYDFIFGDSSGVLRIGAFSTAQYGTWQHLVITYDGANIRAYINGVQAGSIAQTNSLQARGNSLIIGADALLAQRYQGLLDEVMLFNKALTVQEVSDLYNSGGTSQQCGNSITETGEQCDDGNSNNNDACKNDCTLNVCNDGYVYTGVEACEIGQTQACTINSYSGLRECLSDCTGYGSCITSESCGDGIVNGNETCDDGIYNGQPNYCNAQCIGITTPACGNNVQESGEQCDGSDNALCGGNSCLLNCTCAIPPPATMQIISPTNNDVITIPAGENNTNVTITFNAINFNIGGKGGNHIHFSLSNVSGLDIHSMTSLCFTMLLQTLLN